MSPEADDAQVSLGPGETGRIREFWTGFLLAVVTLGFYELWWYYRLNRELRSVGRLLDERKLARSLPFASVTALALGFVAFLPPDSQSEPIVFAALALFVLSLVSQYRFGRRIRLAEEHIGIAVSQRFRPAAILMLFPGGLFVIPYFLWFAYVTRHQNTVLDLAADLPSAQSAVLA